MIKIQESVPSVYYDKSRDFQLIGHLFDLVLNSIKTEADLLFNLPLSTNSDDQLLALLAFTLGLRLSKDKYTSKQLRAVCSVAPKMMRLKGSKAAIDLLCSALVRADSSAGYVRTDYKDNRLSIYVTKTSTCQDLLYELLPYIVPAGIVFDIKEISEKSVPEQITQVKLSTNKVIFGEYKYGQESNTLNLINEIPETLEPLTFNIHESKISNDNTWEELYFGKLATGEIVGEEAVDGGN